ncbi:MAG: hypothetical protein J7484_04105 [Microbacterium sp.]|nr:hypothetical protein [Microbacterium sp.]
MRRSSLLARLITILVDVVLAPLAIGLLATGGTPWLAGAFQYAGSGVDLAALAGPILVQALAIALLVIVVLTAIWSSAGLIAVGLLSIVPLTVALSPSLLLSVYRAPLPREWLDALSYGLPLLLLPPLGMMGVVAAIVRRRPEPRGAALGAVGILLAPVLLAGGAWLLLWGIGRGMLLAMQQFRFDILPDAIGAVLLGVLLLLAGVGTTRWSPFALLLPAVALIAVTAVVAFPTAGFSVYGMLPREMFTALPAVLLLGAGVAAAVVFLAFTAVLLRVRAQSRRSPARLDDPRSAPYGAYPQQTPPYPPGQYPPATPYPPTS